jgi:hypothetical protein
LLVKSALFADLEPFPVARSSKISYFLLAGRGNPEDQGSADGARGSVFASVFTANFIWIDKREGYFTIGWIGKIGNIYSLRRI